MSTKASSLFKLITINVLVIAALLLFSELLYRYIKSSSREYRNDDQLGWAPKENVFLPGSIKESSQGRNYSSDYKTNSLGIRELDDHNNFKNTIEMPLKILAIGDSFTGSNLASNDDMWFGVLQSSSKGKFKVYAYGIGGSGTSQQYLAFRKLKGTINPDILLIQYCTNDPSNDSYESGTVSINRNQDLRRPYHKDGEFYFRSDIKSRIYRFAYNSYIFQKLDNILQQVQYKLYSGYSNHTRTTAELEEDLNHWEDVYKTYVQFARDSGVEEIWSISCSSTSKGTGTSIQTNRWIQASEKVGVKVFKSFGDKPYSAHLSGLDVYYKDGGHLSDIGNKLAGKALYTEISNYLATKNK